MRVLMLASSGESLVGFRGHLLAAMVAEGHHVLVAAPDIPVELEGQLRGLGVQVRRYPLARASISPLGDLRTIASLITLCTTEKPDLVIAYTIKPVVFGLIAAGLSGVPRLSALITGLGYAFGDSTIAQRVTGLVASVLYHLSLPQAHTVFFQNPDDAAEFVSRGLVAKSRCVVVDGSGVALAQFSPTPAPIDPISFLLISRLIREKGIAEFAEAARRLRQEFPSARFDLVGPTDPNPSGIPLSEIAGWQAAGSVRYHGEAKDVRPLIAATSVYVLPSYYREGTPRTVLEAMSCARPVITTDMPGCRETVKDGVNGFLIPPRDIAALTTAMRRFLLDPGLVARMGAQGRAIASERYDVHRVNRRMLAQLRIDSVSAGRRR
jgi:glycosyltransferase involved in cell wall biosynthesis